MKDSSLSLSLPLPRSCSPLPGLKVTVQKFPEGLTTGSAPASCLRSPKSPKGRGRSSAQQQQHPPAAAERRFRFTADELVKIQEQLDEILVHSNGSSKSEIACRMSPHLGAKTFFFLRLFCLPVLPQAACPAACPPAARCPARPALAAPRQGAPQRPAASDPGSSSAHPSIRPPAVGPATAKTDLPQTQASSTHVHVCVSGPLHY